MSNTLAFEFSATGTQGGEALGPDISRQFTVGEGVHDKIVKVAGASSATYVTIWSAAADNLTTFTGGVFIADPKGIRTTAQSVDLRVTSNGSTRIQRVSSASLPITFGPSAQGTGAITLIEVANLATTVAGTDDVVTRLMLWE